MIKRVSVIFVVFVLNAIMIKAQVQVSIIDFGVNPNDGKNVVIAIRNALKVCSARDSSVLVFPKGRYDFWPDFTSNLATIGIQMDKLKKVTIDGGGSEFIFHGKMQIANLTGCENVTLRNFSVDWDHPFSTQGQYVSASEEFIELKIDPGTYVIDNNQFFLIGEGWKLKPARFVLYDKDKKEILYKTFDGDNKALFQGKAEEIKTGIVRFYGKPTIKPEPGTYQEICIETGPYGIQFSESKNILLKDITIYHNPSGGFLGIRSENITMDNANVTVNEKKGRVFSTGADASHFVNCKGLIKIINCKHTGQGDDFTNIHGANSPIATIIDEYSITTGRSAPNIRSGDEIWFVNKTTSQRGEIRTIKSIERIVSENVRNSGNKITFTQPMPKTVQTGDFIENKTWNPSVEIRNCQILKKNRARGILVTTPEKVTIKDNYFHTAGAGIVIEGDFDVWFESGANNDVTISNNIFEDCLTSGEVSNGRFGWGKALISITPSHHPENENTEPYHKNIKIENNTFKTFDIPLVYARSVRGLTFKNNEVIKTNTFAPCSWQKSSFYLDGCRDVVISGNRLADDYTTRLIETEHMKKTDVKVEKNQKINIKAVDIFTKTK